MTFAEELKRIRQRSFLSQEASAKGVNVSFSTVNRRETDRTRPNPMAIKSIKEYCDKNNVEFDLSDSERFYHTVRTCLSVDEICGKDVP